MAKILPLKQSILLSLYAAPEWNDIVELDDANAHSYTVPDGADSIVINPVLQSTGVLSPVYVSFIGTAAAPSADVTDGTASVIVNGVVAYRVGAGKTVSFIRIGANDIDVHIQPYTLDAT